MCDRCGLKRYSSENTRLLAVPKQIGREQRDNAISCAKAQKRILYRARLWVFVSIHRASTNELQALAFIQQHITMTYLKLGELLIRHGHREHVIEINATVKDVLGAEIWALDSRSIHSQRLACDYLALLPDTADVPILRNHPNLCPLIPRPQLHTAPIFARCASTRALNATISSTSAGNGVA